MSLDELYHQLVVAHRGNNMPPNMPVVVKWLNPKDLAMELFVRCIDSGKCNLHPAIVPVYAPTVFAAKSCIVMAKGTPLSQLLSSRCALPEWHVHRYDIALQLVDGSVTPLSSLCSHALRLHAHSYSIPVLFSV
jgi:hypothetical protein